MTKEELAAKLNGREYRDEITEAEEQAAKDAGLVVAFGASDDLVELRGAINDELGEGEFVILGGKVHDFSECETGCKYSDAANKAARETGLRVEAEYGGGGWTFTTAIPHATFDVLEDGARYCRGVVFELPR